MLGYTDKLLVPVVLPGLLCHVTLQSSMIKESESGKMFHLIVFSYPSTGFQTFSGL